MLPQIEIVTFYDTVRKYKSHDKSIELLLNHFYFKVSNRLTEEEFKCRVDDIINHHLKG